MQILKPDPKVAVAVRAGQALLITAPTAATRSTSS
jgi:hypothetical protein